MTLRRLLLALTATAAALGAVPMAAVAAGGSAHGAGAAIDRQLVKDQAVTTAERTSTDRVAPRTPERAAGTVPRPAALPAWWGTTLLAFAAAFALRRARGGDPLRRGPPALPGPRTRFGTT